ncbi:MepB family protein [Paenibacillus monticola]|uniref:MepB domain containing protein n=1 Tax=Paenibacillus monticola TaxID=2666075 RepID=A0A7X2L1J5_9BACL|nr:MepB family protein [Paenibacillus monticola]MRN53185.1 MepB domain containing protein [Paenibacillus monticola]
MDKIKREFLESTIHSDLLATKDLVYTPCSFDCSPPLPETQNAEYGAHVYRLNALSIRFRVGKITPTKVGQFVTLWERIGDGPIQPYDVSDPADFFVISTRNGSKFGQFIFPKAILCDQDIVSNKGVGGKRAFRVYPSWDKPTSRLAQKTQNWQLKYFLEIPLNAPIDLVRARMLYNHVILFKSKISDTDDFYPNY